MAINTGVNVSKLVSYAVEGIPHGVDVTKLVAYAVITSSPRTDLAPALTTTASILGTSGNTSDSLAPTITESVLFKHLETRVTSSLAVALGEVASVTITSGGETLSFSATEVFAPAISETGMIIVPSPEGAAPLNFMIYHF